MGRVSLPPLPGGPRVKGLQLPGALAIALAAFGAVVTAVDGRTSPLLAATLVVIASQLTFLAAALAIGWSRDRADARALLTARRRTQERLLRDGWLVVGVIARRSSGTSCDAIAVRYETVGGGERWYRPDGPLSPHAIGERLPLLIEPGPRDEPALAPTLQRISFAAAAHVVDRRRALEPVEASATTRVPTCTPLLAGGPIGELRFAHDRIEQHRSGTDPVVVDLSRPFTVEACAWLLDGDRAAVQLTIRSEAATDYRHASSGPAVIRLRTAVPQRRVDRALPLRYEPSPFVAAPEFDTVWSFLAARAAARGATLQGYAPAP